MSKKPNDAPSSPTDSQNASFSVSELKKFSDLLPSLSIISLVLVSVFNIGYFSNIGLHFLGLIDLTNIVYSIGLVFGGLIVVANLLGTIIDILIKLARDVDAVDNLRRGLRLIIGTFALIATIVVSLSPSYRPDFFTVEAYFFVLFSLLFIWALVAILLRYMPSGKIKFSEMMVGMIALVSADLSAGKAVASQQISQPKQFYTFFTKSGVVYGLNLIRSSSSGFIVAKDQAISFLSKDEVKAIRSENTVADIKKR